MVFAQYTLASRAGGSGADAWVFDQVPSVNVDVAFTNYPNAGLWASIRHWDKETRNRTTATWSYGNGDYNRPHSLQVQFYIKF